MSRTVATCGQSPVPFAAPRRIPAWLLSLALHVGLLIVAALALQGGAETPLEEPPRAAGIVLAKNSQDVAYFTPIEESLENPDSADPTEAVPASAAAGLPSASDSSNATDANHSPELPGPEELTAAGEGLLQDLIASDGRRGTIFPGLGDEEILANDPLLNAPARPALGPTAIVKIFGTMAVGRSFVMLIDRSKSMGGDGLGAIEAAENELSRALVALTSAQRFQIVAYNQRLSANDPNLIPATSENKTLATKFMAGIVAHGQTEHRMAILAALRNKPEVVYVFTDGGEPGLTQPDLRMITLRADGKTVIHCVQFGFGPLQEEDPFLRRLSRLNGGSFSYVDVSQAR